ncbi:putative Ig domain-containing protein, partial [Rufibacter hautae]
GGATNQAPVVSAPVPDQSVAAGAAYAYTVPSGTFTDPDGDALTLAATQGNGSALPSWLSFSPATRQLSGTAPASAVTLTIRLTASDGKGGNASDQFTLTVTGGGTANGSPVVASAIPDQGATAGTAYSYAFPAGTFTDPDGDALSYSAALAGGGALPSWLSFSPAARSFSGTPSAADAGTLAVRVTASDGKGGSATDEFSLSVSGGTSSGEAYRLNAAGPQETTSRGVFAADAFASGGSKKSPTTDAIAGTTDDAIYRSNRFGTGFSYNIPVKG